MEPAVYPKGSPEPEYFVSVTGAGVRAFASHGYSMANRSALFCPWMAKPKNCLPLRNDQGESHTTSQAMDVAGDIAGLP